MDREERQKLLKERFAPPRTLMTIPPDSSKVFRCLTDFDGFAVILFHRTKRGREFCPRTYDPERSCRLCDARERVIAVAAVPVYNFTDRRQQIALFSGASKGQLRELEIIFGTNGPESTIECTRMGEGLNTRYRFSVVEQPFPLPGNLKVPSVRELAEAVEDVWGGNDDWD